MNADIAFYILSYKLADGYDYHLGYGDILISANLTQEERSFTMTELHAYTGYVVELDMHTHDYGKQPSDLQSYTTSTVSTTLPEGNAWLYSVPHSSSKVTTCKLDLLPTCAVPEVSVQHLDVEIISETALKIHWVPPARIHWKGIIFYHIVLSNLGPRAVRVLESGGTISNVSVSFQAQANHPDPSLANEPLLPENYQLDNLEENYQYSITVTIANSAGTGQPSLPVVQTMPESGKLLDGHFILVRKFENNWCIYNFMLCYQNALFCSSLWTSN